MQSGGESAGFEEGMSPVTGIVFFECVLGG